jgi:hypothetical protein
MEYDNNHFIIASRAYSLQKTGRKTTVAAANHHGHAQYRDHHAHGLHGPYRVGAPWACRAGLETTDCTRLARTLPSGRLVGLPRWTGTNSEWECDGDGKATETGRAVAMVENHHDHSRHGPCQVGAPWACCTGLGPMAAQINREPMMGVPYPCPD